MKKYILFLIFIFIVTLLKSQPTWQVEIPCDEIDCWTSHKKLIKTSDGNYVVTLTSSLYENFTQTYQYIVKYSNNGDLIWEKSYNFGAITPEGFLAGPYVYDVIEDSDNGDLVFVGKILDGDQIPKEQAYFFRTNSHGDSISLKKESTHKAYVTIKEILNNEFMVTRGNGYSRLNDEGNTLDEKLIPNLAGAGIVVNDNNFISALTWFPDTVIYQSIDLYTGELQVENKIGVLEDLQNLIIENSEGSIIGYSGGLIKMSDDLEIIWQQPVEEYDAFIGNTQSGEAVIELSDGGYILGGQSYGAGRLYLIKTNADGYCVWKHTYSSSFFGNNFWGLTEANDHGIVFLADDWGGNTNLIKVGANGLLTPTIELHHSLELQVFPNPCVNELILYASFNLNGAINIFDSFGRSVLTTSVEGNQKTINVNHLVSGVYFLKHVSKSKGIRIMKFVKR